VNSLRPIVAILVVLLLVPAFADAGKPRDGDKDQKDKKDKRVDVEIRLTLQSHDLPTFDWDLNRPVMCKRCPQVFAENTTILAPSDLQSARQGAPCQVFYWTGEKPRIDTRPVLGIVYIHPECALSWVSSG